MAKINGAGRADLFSLDPDDIIIPESGPLYDERSEWPIDESLVQNIIFLGQIEPINVRKNGSIIEVVTGRQRVKAIREINRRARERGEKPMRILARLLTGTDAEHYSIMISENEIRKNDTIAVKIKKAKNLTKFGYTADQIAKNFAIDKRTAESWLALSDVAPEVHEAVCSGDIAAGVGVALSELPREDQAPALEKMKAEGKPTVKEAQRIVRAESRPGRPLAPKIKRGGAAIKTWLDEISDKPILEQTKEEKIICFMLEWFLGSVEREELAEAIG